MCADVSADVMQTGVQTRADVRAVTSCAVDRTGAADRRSPGVEACVTTPQRRIAGGCVAYSISTSAHEARMCSLWDALSLEVGTERAGGDGNPSRSCFVGSWL